MPDSRNRVAAGWFEHLAIRKSMWQFFFCCDFSKPIDVGKARLPYANLSIYLYIYMGPPQALGWAVIRLGYQYLFPEHVQLHFRSSLIVFLKCFFFTASKFNVKMLEDIKGRPSHLHCDRHFSHSTATLWDCLKATCSFFVLWSHSGLPLTVK